MSYMKSDTSLGRLLRTRSMKSFAKHFLLGNMAGQKLFLHNETVPRVVNISFNEKTCMYSCRMCPYTEKDVRAHYRKASEMDFETLRGIVRSVPNDPHYSFDISAIGETLEFEPLPEFIAYMKRERPLVNTIISTNGVLMTPERFEKLADSGLDSIQFSLYAENAEDHAHITGTRTFARVKENILAACAMARKRVHRPFLQAFMIECAENAHTADRFLAFWSQQVDKAFLRPLYNVGRKLEGMTPTFEPVLPERRYPCITPWYSTAVRSSGEVLPCYMFHWSKDGWDRSLGNIREQTLAELWRTPAFRKFRQAHLSGDLRDYPICRRCDLWSGYTNVWKRQPGETFAFDPVRLGDFLKPAPEYRGG